jgi:predicted alpha/beta superfamily hydrolase
MNDRRAASEGRLRTHPRFASKFLSTKRDLTVYLPLGYEEAGARYPVLYLHDGQNLFDPERAFAGQEWAVDATADELIESGAIQPLIIVGVDHTGVRRMSEYTPTRDRRRRKGGKADRHAELLAREVKPFIDSEYRTLKGASDTGLGGSSLGGLATTAAWIEYPRVFGKLAVMSPATWWDGGVIIEKLRASRARSRPRVWLDIGTSEGDDPATIVQETRMLRDAMLERGWREGDNLRYCEDQGAGHNELAWWTRLGWALRFLFAAR